MKETCKELDKGLITLNGHKNQYYIESRKKTRRGTATEVPIWNGSRSVEYILNHSETHSHVLRDEA